MDWNGKPYHSLDYELKKRFGSKVYKLALNGGMTCPNRDGTLGSGGCIFCSAGGSGEFAAPSLGCRPEDIDRQLQSAITRIHSKMGSGPDAYIAYFQSYTNTYAPVSYLEPLFSAAIAPAQVKVLSIATRPDCLPEPVLQLCSRLNQKKPVWIELGLQTIHEESARNIRRGYDLSCFLDSLHRLREHGIEVIVHVILGLPGESRAQMLETISWLGEQDIQGIKLQLLHVLKGTDLARLYEEQPFHVFSMDEYIDLILDGISILPPRIVIHRLTGDGPKNLLLAPLWSANKRLVLNTLTRRFKESNITQGCRLPAAQRSE